jgi:hypothetical protein
MSDGCLRIYSPVVARQFAVFFGFAHIAYDASFLLAALIVGFIRTADRELPLRIRTPWFHRHSDAPVPSYEVEPPAIAERPLSRRRIRVSLLTEIQFRTSPISRENQVVAADRV